MARTRQRLPRSVRAVAVALVMPAAVTSSACRSTGAAPPAREAGPGSAGERATLWPPEPLTMTAPSLAHRLSALQARVDRAAARNRQSGGGGVILWVESADQGVLWSGAEGAMAQRGRRIRPTDTFEVASVTKTFTAAAVLLLVEAGKLELDRPVGDILPSESKRRLRLEGREGAAGMTLRRLLQHRSGLPDYWTDPPFENGVNAFMRDFLADAQHRWRPFDLLPYIARLGAVAAPGTRYHYSDSGYVLAALAVEQASGKPLHEVLRELIFLPLGMRDTSMSYREPGGRPKDEAHRYEGKQDLHGQLRQSADWGGGGLVSSAPDLARFLLALMEGRVFKRPSSLAAMTQWHPTDNEEVDYGLGLFRIRLDDGLGELWGHDGHGNAFMYYWPQRRIAWVGTLNQTENDWWDMVEAGLSIVAHGQPPQEKRRHHTSGRRHLQQR